MKAIILQGQFKPINPSGWAVALSKFEGKLVDVLVSQKRSLSQNARYWSLIVPAFSQWTGFEAFPESAEKIGLTPKESAHQILKAMFVGTHEVTLPDGSVVTVCPSTAALTVAQFSELTDKAERFLNAHQIFLPVDERKQ